MQPPRKGAVGGGGDPANHGYAQVPGSGAPGEQVGFPGAGPEAYTRGSARHERGPSQAGAPARRGPGPSPLTCSSLWSRGPRPQAPRFRRAASTAMTAGRLNTLRRRRLQERAAKSPPAALPARPAPPIVASDGDGVRGYWPAARSGATGGAASGRQGARPRGTDLA